MSENMTILATVLK